MYSALRELLFCLPPEVSHSLSLNSLDTAAKLGLSGLLAKPMVEDEREVMGLRFPNAVGLAAGLDKNAEHIDGLAALGFGFIEVGTVTPKAQPGNPKPRLFRLKKARAIINRMGFNNAGLDALMAEVEASRYEGILGINIGKNKDTPAEDAVSDYLCCLQRVYEHASYVTVNLSSPNTPGRRDLQFGEPLRRLLDALKKAQGELNEQYGRYVPLAVKIAPDMADEDLRDVAQALRDAGIDGVIATNTTIDRTAVQGLPHAEEAGGLSGAPVRTRSTEVVKALSECLQGEMPIIGVGGIDCAEAAVEKQAAGASLVQLYSGFIYEGPRLISDCALALKEQALK